MEPSRRRVAVAADWRRWAGWWRRASARPSRPGGKGPGPSPGPSSRRPAPAVVPPGARSSRRPRPPMSARRRARPSRSCPTTCRSSGSRGRPGSKVEVLGPHPEGVPPGDGKGLATVGLRVGVGYSLRVSNLPDRPGVELFPMIEILGHLHRPAGVDPSKYPIRVLLRDIDIEAAADRGQLVTQVIYLEDPDSAVPLALGKDETPVVTISAAEDPEQGRPGARPGHGRGPDRWSAAVGRGTPRPLGRRRHPGRPVPVPLRRGERLQVALRPGLLRRRRRSRPSPATSSSATAATPASRSITAGTPA